MTGQLTYLSVHSKNVTKCFLTGSHLLVHWVEEGTTTIVPVSRAPEDAQEGDECAVKWTNGKLYDAKVLKKGD